MIDELKTREEVEFLEYAHRRLGGKERDVALFLCMHFRITGIEGYHKAAEGLRQFVNALLNDHQTWSLVYRLVTQAEKDGLQRRLAALIQYAGNSYRSLNTRDAPRGERAGEEYIDAWKWHSMTPPGLLEVLKALIHAWPILEKFNKKDEEHYLAILVTGGHPPQGFAPRTSKGSEEQEQFVRSVISAFSHESNRCASAAHQLGKIELQRICTRWEQEAEVVMDYLMKQFSIRQRDESKRHIPDGSL